MHAVYIYIYIYIYVCHIDRHINLHAHAYICTRTCMHTCTIERIYVPARMQSLLSIYMANLFARSVTLLDRLSVQNPQTMAELDSARGVEEGDDARRAVDERSASNRNVGPRRQAQSFDEDILRLDSELSRPHGRGSLSDDEVINFQSNRRRRASGASAQGMTVEVKKGSESGDTIATLNINANDLIKHVKQQIETKTGIDGNIMRLSHRFNNGTDVQQLQLRHNHCRVSTYCIRDGSILVLRCVVQGVDVTDAERSHRWVFRYCGNRYWRAKFGCRSRGDLYASDVSQRDARSRSRSR